MAAQGAERSLKIQMALDLGEEGMVNQIKKLDRLNDFYIDMALDIFKVESRLERAGDADPEEGEWAVKAEFAKKKMIEDFDKMNEARNRLRLAIEAVDKDNQVLDDTRRVEAKADHDIKKMIDPDHSKHKSALERDYPSDDGFMFEKDEDEPEEEEEYDLTLPTWGPDDDAVYNAFFVEHAKAALVECSSPGLLKKIEQLTETSVRVYNKMKES